MALHDKRFPNETDEYRSERDRLLAAEIELRSQIEQVAAQRRRLPPGGRVPEDYSFDEMTADGRVEPVRLSQLFAPGHTSLIVYGFMYGPEAESPCPMCTSLIDGFNASAVNLGQRVSMVVVAKSPIGRIIDFARRRGWDRIRLLSSSRTSFNRDYLAEDGEGNQLPMANVFSKGRDGIHHTWGSELLYVESEGDPCHVDLVWPLWNLLDLTPEGRGADWYPQLDYE
jgi:predicted dithiol-disulfide oxidoreductase (DUF899 family)